MFISKIELNGFKSFAQKTEIRFSHDITGIVGPNGCGKSNIVDAFRWVLGEQKTSILRSDRMENVIFNGSAKRKPLNLAEVSITIDNSKKILPLDFSEVVITRRLFRSGESEYLLNKNPGRLKDITNLIVDKGIGPSAYSIMELKMVESILSDKHEERQKIFEEAAGISKYKNLRNATLRKLDSTRQDIIRINDIIIEVERTVNNLKKQVKKAEQYENLMKRLKKKKYTIITCEIMNYKNKLEQKQNEISDIENALIKTTRDLANLEAKVESKKKELVDSEKKLENKQKQLREKIEEFGKTENSLNVNKERKLHLENELIRLKKEGASLHTRVENLKTRNIETSEIIEKCINDIAVTKLDYQKSEKEFISHLRLASSGVCIP